MGVCVDDRSNHLKRFPPVRNGDNHGDASPQEETGDLQSVFCGPGHCHSFFVSPTTPFVNLRRMRHEDRFTETEKGFGIHPDSR